ncbi:MAG TPA: Hsp20/alpha crystallin family protein [Syntrophobacteria bacterium]|nr:Hsp20/alpha crystallin family protein [Syntrophobacteria bacterium]
MTGKEDDLLSDLLSMRERMERLLSEREAAVEEGEGGSEPLAEWQPQVDLYETDAEVLVLAELPGVASEDFTLTIHEGRLVLEGERQAPHGRDQMRYLQIERRYGPFRRSIALPGKVEDDSISAKLTNGVLEVVISKKAKQQGRRVAVQAGE